MENMKETIEERELIIGNDKKDEEKDMPEDILEAIKRREELKRKPRKIQKNDTYNLK